MRVALLSKALVHGAYQRKCELIAAQPDVELTVLVPPAWGSHTLERVHTDGYALRIIPIRFNGNFHLHHYPTLRREMAHIRPDIVHIDEEPYNLATWLALKAAGSRSRTLFFSWQNILRRYPPPFNWIERDVLRRADAAIAGSDAARRVWSAKGFARPIAVIPQFGVDEGLFSPSAQPPQQHHFHIGYAGRMVHEKGVDVLLRALARLPNRAHLTLAGAGPCEGRLRDLAQQLGIADRVRFRAPLPTAHMPAFYRELDAFVLPSRTMPNWKEQFGRVLIEAMACGVPVVGSRCGEIPQVVADAGLLFDEEDVDGLCDRLITLMTQPRLCSDLAERGRARVLDCFTMQHVAEQTVAMYRHLIG